MMRSFFHLTVLGLAFTGCALDASPDGEADLGDFTSLDKADSITVEVPFTVRAMAGTTTPASKRLRFRTLGLLEVSTVQTSTTRARLQLSAESTVYRRRSQRGYTPKLMVPGTGRSDADGELVEYTLDILNWSATTARGTLRVKTDVPHDPGFAFVANSPDCEGCEDPANGLRDRLVESIQSARRTIDIAMYGLDDNEIIEALCEAEKGGVAVRAVSDETSLSPTNSRSYWDGFSQLQDCGVELQPVVSGGTMHHKFLLIDRGLTGPVLITGSTNFVDDDLFANHNHMLWVYGAADLNEQYQAEFDQLWRHCATDRLDTRTCRECTPACTEDNNEEGPFDVAGSPVSVFFSPSDDALVALRGEMVTRRLATPDPACRTAAGDCVCRPATTGWNCEYCATGADGWGLIGEADRRVLVDIYSFTDQCLALGIARAEARGVETLAIFDFVKAGSKYSRDEYLCAEGVPTLITNWGGGSAQVRNHNKLIIVDDVVFDGSMNVGDSGSSENDENTLMIHDADLADGFADYVAAEAALLASLGVRSRAPAACICDDMIDQDGDGRTDHADPDCDGRD